MSIDEKENKTEEELKEIIYTTETIHNEPKADNDITGENIEEVLNKYDRESNIRLYSGVPKYVLKWILVCFSAYVIYQNMFTSWDARLRRASFVAIVIPLVFLIYPAKKGTGKKRENYVPWYDLILAILGSICYWYYVVNFQRIIDSAGRISFIFNSNGVFQPDVIVAIIGILILLEGCRRAVGIPIVCVCLFFLGYGLLFAEISVKKLLYTLFYTTQGVLGTPINACSSYLMLFLIFGAFLERTGIADYFINVAKSLTGWSSGGPAKVAVISSALCGTVSGSSVANTVTTGSITIPMMKKTGYKPEFAGAVEAAASTGGQIMPPIMGTAAFLMSEIVGVSYGQIIGRAVLPAVLYFTGIFVMVHLEAKRLNLKGIPRKDLPPFGKTFISNCYLLIPLILLIVMILQGFTMPYAAVYATIASIICSFLGKKTRITLKTFFEGLEAGARNAVSVSMACGVAGVIAGVITVTGLGNWLIKAVMQLAGNATFLALLLIMVACIILGMGVPTTANYIIMATTCAPLLIRMGIPTMCAHMFVFYFGIIADITPPVALAAFAGSAIAGANPIKTGFTATKLAIAAFIIPYIFAYNPALLFIDATVLEIIQIFISAVLGMFGVSMAIAGFLKSQIMSVLRIAAFVGGILLITPGTLTDLIGFGMVGAIVLFQIVQAKHKQV